MAENVQRNMVRDWFRATERCNINHLNRLKDQVNIEVSTTWSMNNEDHRNVTALTLSAYIGRKEVVKWFIELGCRVNVATHLGWTPLHFAASQGFVSTVDMLCQAGAKIDVKTNRGETAIQLALRGNMRDTVRKLLNRGASIDNLEHTKMGGRGGRGREMHSLSRSRGGGTHSRVGGLGLSSPGRGSGHHPLSTHSHPGHHHSHHHGGHYGGQGSGRDLGIGGAGAGGNAGSSVGGAVMSNSGGGVLENAEVARKRRELFRQIGDESRLGKAVRQLMRDPATRHNAASVKQALIDHLMEPMNQIQARQWKRQSEMLVDSLETLICEHQTPDNRANRRLLCDCIFLIVDQWSETMYKDYLLRLVDSATQGRSAVLRCAMLELLKQFLDREFQRRQKLSELAAQHHESSVTAFNSDIGSGEEASEINPEGMDNGRDNHQSPDRGEAISFVSFDLVDQVLRLLNSDDSAPVIAASCRVLLAYARLFRVSFLEEEHFFTLVDHVVGWCVDPKTADTDADMLCRCVAECRPLWRARPQFAKEMTTNLLEDVESNVPSIPSVSDTTPGAMTGGGKVRIAIEKERASLEESLIRISRFLRVACAICRSLNLQAEDCPSSVHRQFDYEALFKMCGQIVNLVSPILRNLSHFLKSTMSSCPSPQAALTVVLLSNSPALFAGANWLLSDLVVNLITNHSHADKCQSLYNSIVIFLANQMIFAAQANIIQHHTDYQLSVISLTEVLVDKTRMGLNFDWVVLYRLLGPLSPIHNYKLTTNNRVQRRLLALFTRFAHLESLQLVDVFYQILLSDFEVCLQTLIQACNSNSKVALVRENGFQERRYSPEEALALAIFNLGVISEIGVSQLAGLWSLTPTLFDLFVKYAPVRDQHLMQTYPHLHVAMFTALLAHCREQKWLVECSRLAGQSADSAAEFPRRDGYLEELLALLTDMLESKGCSPPLALCDLLLDAVEGVIGRVADKMLWSVLESVPMMDTISALLTFISLKVRLGGGSNLWSLGSACLRHIFRACRLVERFLSLCSPSRVTDSSIPRLASDLAHAVLPLGGGVTQPLLGILARLPPSTGPIKSGKGLVSRQWRAGRHLTSGALALRLPVWTGDRFRVEHCQMLLTAFLCQHPPPNAAPDWPQRLFSSLCLAEGGMASGEGHERLLVVPALRWAALAWETVRFVLERKLKVAPWGKPTDAFLEVEQLLHRLAGRKSTVPHWTVSFILLFVEWLERGLYQAYEGAATIPLQPPLSPPIRHFFRTNRRTCLTWVTRNRPGIMRVAAGAGLYPLVVRHGMAWLQAEGTVKEETEEVLRMTARALRQLGQGEMLKGISSIPCAARMDLLLAGMSEAACGRMEKAQSLLEAQLEEKRDEEVAADNLRRAGSGDVVLLTKPVSTPPSNSARPDAIARCVFDELIHCYSQMHDIRGLRALRERLQRWTSTGPYSGPASEALHSRADQWRYWACVGRLQNWEEEKKPSWMLDDNLASQERKLYSALTSGLPTRVEKASSTALIECSALAGGLGLHWPSSLPASLRSSVRSAQLCRDSTPGNFTLSLPHLHLRRLATHFIPDLESDEATIPVVRWCRRFNNVQAATRLLIGENAKLEDLSDLLTTDSNLGLELQQEVSKVLYEAGKKKEAWLGLCQAMTGALRRQSEVEEEEAVRLQAKAALSLARWLRRDGEDSLDDSADSALNFISELSQRKWVDGCVPTIAAEEEGEADRCVENVIGRLSVLASKLSPMMAKAWFAVGDWSFERSRADLKALARRQFQVSLTDSERQQLEQLLPRGHTEEELEEAASILASLPCTTTSGPTGEQELRQRLQDEVFCLQVAPPDQLEAIMLIWRGVLDRVYGLSVSAANGYFTFLRLSAGEGEGEENDKERRMTAALRLLKLLANHIHELGHLLNEGFANTPTEPWLNIIPQVFARLNHPSPAVRDCLTGLVCRLGKDAPHRIVYPAVVGAACASSKSSPEGGEVGEGMSRDSPESAPAAGSSLNGEGEDEDMDEVVKEVTEMEEEKAEDGQDDPLLLNTFTSLMEAMTRDNPILVREVVTFVEEMRRITVLWDELWLGTLSQHAEEMQKKMVQLQSEIKKVQEHEHLSEMTKSRLIQIIYETYMKPIVLSLEKIRFITSTSAETPHEEWFQEQFDTTISEVIARLKSPTEPSRPEAAAHALKSLHQTLHQKSQARRRLIGQGQLDLAQISPRLAAIDSSVIPMPGEVKGGVSIREIQNAFFILPTKTKPKKLIFVGDNGQRYPYLFKGLEDLHLDERIMQFLGTVNAMFTRLNRAPLSDSPKFFARHYAVTPLGPRSALIQMVQGATPLFPLYKKWQQREAIAQAAKQQRTVPPPPPPPVLSPSELFFSKLRPALEAKGFHTGDDAKILESRKDWPISVLRSVLGELMRETPNDLLSQELWLSSVSSVDWWQSVQNFARSVAVMSGIGYVLGLGDRHLDNVMVDLSNGDIVHIDYNVCFEKGKNLKVPETVPFRLTAVLRHALGPAGVEGMFRSSCERVLKTLRERQDVLLTLLDAFVYDPLIDWTPGSESGYAGAHYGGRSDAAKGKFPTRRQLEREITQQFLGIRAVQMDPALRLWQAEFLRVLENVRGPAECLVQLASDLGAETRRLQLYREMQDYLSVTDVEVEPSLWERYARCCKRERSRQLVAEAVEAKGEEVRDWCQRHSDALAFLRSDFVPSLIAKLGRKPSPTSLVEYQVSAVAFLESAGQASLAEAAGAVVVKIDGLLTARTTCLTDCLNVITVYRSHTELFREEALQDRFAVLNTLLSGLEKTLKKSTCRSSRETYRKRFMEDEETPLELPVDQMEDQLRNQVSELSRRLAATLAERRQVPAANSEDNVDVIYRTLLHTVSIDGGAAYKLAIAESLQTMCRDWINLDERLVKGGGAASDSLNLDNDESSSWFVYEESCFSLLLNQLAVFLSHVHVGSEALKVVRLLDELSSKLRKLHSNLCNILLPEAARILTGLADLDGPLSRVLELADAGTDLITQLEARMKAGGDEETAPPAAASTGPGSGEMGELSLKVRRVRKEWLRLLETMEKEQSHLLILAFHNELSQMEAVFLPLVLAFRALFMPQDWYFVDALTSAYHCLQPVWYLPHSDALFLDLLFLKGLRLLADVVRICRRFSQAFHQPGVEMQGNADSRAIVSHYLNFVWGGVLCGVGPSLCAFLLCALLEDAHLSLSMVAAEQTRLYNGMTAPAHSLLQLAVEYRAQEHASLTVTQQLPPPWHDFPYLHSHVTSLVTSMSNVAQRQHTQVVMDNCVKMVEGRLQRAQRALASFQWLHTDRLAREADLATPSRASILKELQRNCTQLETQNETLKEVAAEMKRQHDSIAQRLRWAQGANPSVSSVLEAVEEAYGKNEEVLREDSSNVDLVLAAVQSVLHFENFRTRSAEAVAQDRRIDDTFDDWLAELEGAEVAEACEVTDLEQELMRVAEEEEEQGEEEGWTERLTASLASRCTELVARLKDRKKSAVEEIERLGQFEGELKASVGRHTRLLNSHDIRTVLKAMARFDDPRVKTYAREYRRFSTEFSAMLRMLGELEKEKSESAIVNVATQVASHRAKLAALVQPLRHHLRKLAPNLDIEEDEHDNETKEEREEEKKMDVKPKTGITGGSLTQARNPFALAVWRRVQAKLTGRDGPAMRGRDPFTVEEQVDWIIKEATNLDNLALMYEGWTAWL